MKKMEILKKKVNFTYSKIQKKDKYKMKQNQI